MGCLVSNLILKLPQAQLKAESKIQDQAHLMRIWLSYALTAISLMLQSGGLPLRFPIPAIINDKKIAESNDKL